LKQPEITIQLAGGLGNQLHGLATGFVCSQVLGCGLKIDPRGIPFGSNSSRRFELHNLYQISNPSGQVTFIRELKFIKTRLALRKIELKVLGRMSRRENRVSYWDSSESPKDQISKISSGDVLGGGFIDFRWLNLAPEYETLKKIELRKLSPLLVRYLEEMGNSFIAIHIRTGDYRYHEDIFVDLPQIYYEKALVAAHQQMTDKIVVFTDDFIVAQAKYPSILKLADNVLAPNSSLTPLETLYLMSRAKVVITANSTFSTWAGWFAEHNGGSVITPFRHLLNSHWEDHFPETWERIKF
jgi:hypothetical protein